MLERLIAWFCNNYLGRYFENLNTDQLSVALLQGEVELENVPLRRDILDHLGLPVQIHVGYVGKISFQIPLRKIRSEPWVISLEQVYLIAGPKDKTEPYTEEEEAAELERKIAALDLMEAEWRSENDPQSLASSSLYSLTYSSWLSYGASLVTNIVQNIQLKVKDVHIRYEDSVSCPGQVFACGIRVESVTAQTCDDNWTPKFVPHANQGTVYKLLELEGLAAYWDTSTEIFSDLSLDKLSEKLMQPCCVERHEFLLAPVNGHARLKRNCSAKPLRSIGQPRVACDFQLDKVNVELRDAQYHQLVHCCRSLELLARGLELRRFRCDSEEAGSRAQRQWRFAIACAVHDVRKRMRNRNWPSALRRARDVVAYVRSFRDHLLNASAVAPDAKLQRERLEAELELDVLQVLRTMAMQQIAKSQPPIKSELSEAAVTAGSSTLFQRWFASWWTGAESTGQTASEDRVEHEIMETLEDAMRDDTVRQRDILPLQLTNTLKQGVFRLSARQRTETGQSWSTLLELECDNVVQEWESRPRLKSHKFHVSLGNVWVRDCSTPGTLFPLVVCPLRKHANVPKPAYGVTSLIPAFSLPFFRSPPASRPATNVDHKEEPIFDLVYEKRPPGSDWNHRLKVTSLAVECVYNHRLLQRVAEVFSVHYTPSEERSQLGERIRQAARSRFEAVKQKTRQELGRTWAPPGGDLGSQSKQRRHHHQSWDLLVNVSAPHILMPETVTSRESLLLIVDFGHFHVTRTDVNCIANELASAADEDDDEEEYCTPCSTPQNEPSLASTPLDGTGDAASAGAADDCADKYNVHFSDLQLLVCRVKDNWKQAHLKGTSIHHLLDRFSILIHVEKCRRGLGGLDKPFVTLNASLPHLVAHVNEPKVHALLSVSKQFQSSTSSNSPTIAYDEEMNDSEDDSDSQTSASDSESSRWLLALFSVEHMSVEVQSRGRSVAELQVGGVQASYSLRQSDSAIHLAVHSLLLVDAMQTLGPDYELLIASHRHVSVDSTSGSLKESEPTSPVSPSSPDPSAAAGHKISRATSPVSLAQALTSLQTDTSWRRDGSSQSLLAMSQQRGDHQLKSEALIIVDVTTSGPTKAVRVHFNSLDVIANQDTVVELAGFFQRVLPKAANKRSDDPVHSNQARLAPFTPPTLDGTTDITFDFHRLTVLLLRSTVKDDCLVGRKVATLSVTEAHISANVAEDALVHGYLGGLQVLDLTPEGQKHQRIVSVGHDPLVEQNRNLYTLVSQGLYRTDKETGGSNAFSFKFSKCRRQADGVDSAPLGLDIRMASLCYTHSVQFMAEASACVSEFQQSVSNLAMSLRVTAAEMAADLLHRGTEGLAQTAYIGHRPQANAPEGVSGLNATGLSGLRFSALFESPIVVLPRSANSSQVLVAHLGQIEMSNDRDSAVPPTRLTEEPAGGTQREHFEIEVRDMSLYSLNVDDKWRSSFSHFYAGPTAFLRVTAQELYSCSSPHANPILHDTLLKFSLHRITDRPTIRDDDDDDDDSADAFVFQLTDVTYATRRDVCDVFQVNGCVVSPLQVSLSKAQYEQIIDSLDNLNWSNKLETGCGAEFARSDHATSPKFTDRRDPSKQHQQRHLAVNLHFHLPRFSMQLIDDAAADRAIVRLSFEDFQVAYEQSCTHSATVHSSLKSLVLEDLMVAEDSKHRRLVASNERLASSSRRSKFTSYLSASCPDLRSEAHYASGSRSLPAKLEVFDAGWKRKVKNASARLAREPCPETPPCSPVHRDGHSATSMSDNNLVFIKILLVDPDSPDLALKYNSTQRFVEVNFNALDLVVNLESWVMVLDFFGASGTGKSKRHRHHQQRHSSKSDTAPSPGYQDWSKSSQNGSVNSRWEVDVRSFNVLLNRQEHEVAEATVSNLTWEMASMRGNLDVNGKLGSVTVNDLTSAGRMYKERFLTSGNEALDFQFFAFSADDPHLARDYDVRLNLNMASVTYVHTRRFYDECYAVIRQFNALRSEAAARGPASLPSRTRWRHGTRVLLNVEAGSPVIVVPVSSTSEHLLVIDLGKISVSNHFVMSDGSTSSSVKNAAQSTRAKSGATNKTLSLPLDAHGSNVLVDVIEIALSNVDVCTGQREPANRSQIGDLILGSYLVRRSGSSMLRETCEMAMQVRRNLDAHLCHPVADIDIRALLSSVECSVDEYQYKLVRGLLAFNLGEDCSPVGDSSAAVGSSPSSAKDSVARPGVWSTLKLHIELVNVALDVVMSRTGPLSSIKFIDSGLVYESKSDGSRDVDLVSQRVTLNDSRRGGASAFTHVLAPVTRQATKRDGSLQAELHYRSTGDFTRFTLVLNNMRLLAAFDWWLAFREFVTLSPDELRGAETFDSVRPPRPSQSTKWTSTSAKPSPIVVSTGVMSKRAAIVEAPHAPVEFKVNISDSEVVIIEDTSSRDSSAVILKGTAILAYRPQIQSKPLSCQLNRVEIFSSQLSREEDTALSIVDPATISIEVVAKSSAFDSSGILEATSVDCLQTLEIQAHQLILRLSYNDVKLFLRIVDGVPRQLTESPLDVTADDDAERLQSLGFAATDCHAALEVCDGNLEEAALWLTLNASTTANVTGSPSEMKIRAIEVRTGCISLCVIDDCRDADVPLLEITASQLLLRQSMDSMKSSSGDGSIHCQLAIEYYNRILSGWEPFIEPFKCHVKWDFVPLRCSSNRSVLFDTDDIVNVNVTRPLLELFKTVRLNWTEDYYGRDSLDGSTVRHRSPFVPFALQNATGSPLKFRTQTVSLLADSAPTGQSKKRTDWMTAEAGHVIAFTFEQRAKLRHGDSHEMHTHQVLVEIDGWAELVPVSVDRVGVYFRHATLAQVSPSRTRPTNVVPTERDLERVLVVIAVTLEGSARRLITVRSALQVTNSLEETVELRLEPAAFSMLPSKTLRVPPCTTYPIPIAYLMSQIYVRPMAEKQPPVYSFCHEPVRWRSVQLSESSSRHSNPVVNDRDLAYRFAVRVQREPFPIDKAATPDGELAAGEQPAHTITLLSPLVVVNLLPYELLWQIKAIESGIVKPGKSTAIHTVDVAAGFHVTFRTENFVHASELVIGSSPSNYTTRLRLYDSANRLLLLQAKVSCKTAGAVKLSISAPYWLVNKAGIPLIFRQEGASSEAAAGQFDEHEMARSVAPMLFSFTDREASPTLTCRAGSGLHAGCQPQWCKPFPLEKGAHVRSVALSPRDGRPELVYLVGVSIRSGRGRYRDTHIVTFAPCCQLYNQSSWRLEVSQACFATTFTDPGAQSTYLNLVPGCHLPFHWPRLDKDQLLCIRLPDVAKCHWSGGFAIRAISSLHANVRHGDSGQSVFVRIEVFQQECTHCVVFTDATGFPAPLRIDNWSQVPVVFHQTDVPDALLRVTVRPGCSVPYVWDEPTRPARLTLVAPGGASSSYDMATLAKGNQLTYENFTYVCLTATFEAGDGGGGVLDGANRELVLDVPEGTRVVLAPKQTGKRSQLWRMTGSGMLQHEGSSPPRDPTHPHVNPSRVLVLDIAGPALQPSEYVPLMLRKPDARRQLTQTWRFVDGRLCCGHSNVFVQAKDGFYGLRPGNDVVLGPAQPVTHHRMASGIAAEQAIHWQRLRPGSGCLSVKTVTDGPTRVLQVSDFILKAPAEASTPSSTNGDEAAHKAENHLRVHMQFKNGLGLSVVNHWPPEELAYCRLSNIVTELVVDGQTLGIEASVGSIQIDNSVRDPQCPVVAYVARLDETRHVPAVHVAVERQMAGQWNADIFKQLVVTFKNLIVNLDENQLFKLIAFTGSNQSDLELERVVDEGDFETQRSVSAATSVEAKRYYFGLLKLVLDQVRLSVYTSSILTPELKAIKRKLGLTLIRFEDANIELRPFVRNHPFETAHLIFDSILKHYKDELKSQAAKILVTTDFLGNPLGFVNDVSEGVSGFINEGNVGALVQNVTFGLSNSAAKVTGSLSDGLGRVTMDERHEEIRQRLLRHTGHSSDHLVAGLKGLGIGILGGMTSIFTQTYEGVASEGFTGLFTGFGKGLVGTVTKPAVGVLDLATGAASAVRDSSRSSSKEVPKRMRPPRLVIGPGGVLPRYSEKQGRGQELLFQLNKHRYEETFIAYEALGSQPGSLHMLISSEHVRVFSISTQTIEIDVHLSELGACRPVTVVDYGTESAVEHYVELHKVHAKPDSSQLRGPQVLCESEALAKRVAQEVNYAKSVYEENCHSLVSPSKF